MNSSTAISSIENTLRLIENLLTWSRNQRNETGTGFGLILCQEFVDHHNGRILVESEPGKGSVFTVELPLIKENQST